MNMDPKPDYDVVIVGAGIAGALMAKRLGAAGKRVLILEAGPDSEDAHTDDLERFYLSQAKVPESPYLPPIADSGADGVQSPSDPSSFAVGRPTTLMLDESTWQNPATAYLEQEGPLAFASTYERGGGGTMRHWLGTSLRFLPADFEMQTRYGVEVDWPIGYDDLEPWYCEAEREIGVSADTAAQGYGGITFQPGYHYPMQALPNSLVDKAIQDGLDGLGPVEGISLSVTNTPAGRNSEPYQGRRACAGNTNCIPICPIQAKYDATVTLQQALQYPSVEIRYQCVASEILLGPDSQVKAIRYLTYDGMAGPATGSGFVTASRYVIAAHAIETPRLLLMSTNGGQTPNGVANSSGLVGRNLMDHPMYLAWAMAKEPVYGYRGPLSTAGIENLRDGAFRSKHAAYRIEIGNEGWNFPIGDPYTTTLDLILGTNASQLNPGATPLWGSGLVTRLNAALTGQFRLGFLLEQTPDAEKTGGSHCSVTLSATWVDRLGLPRPHIRYDLSDYTKMGFVSARRTATAIFAAMGATEFTQHPGPEALGKDPTVFAVTYNAADEPVPLGTPGATTEYFRFFGAGHIVGTCRMGSEPSNSVVNPDQRSWDHGNLFLVGSGVFPTVATGNPTLTLAALTLKAAKTVLADLNAPPA